MSRRKTRLTEEVFRLIDVLKIRQIDNNTLGPTCVNLSKCKLNIGRLNSEEFTEKNVLQVDPISSPKKLKLTFFDHQMPNLLGRGERFQVDYSYGTKKSSNVNVSVSKPIHSLGCKESSMPNTYSIPTLTTSGEC